MGGALVGAWAEKFRVRFPRGGPVQHILLDIDDDEDDEHEENQKNDEDDEDEDEDDEDDDENGDDDEFNLRMIKDEERWWKMRLIKDEDRTNHDPWAPVDHVRDASPHGCTWQRQALRVALYYRVWLPPTWQEFLEARSQLAAGKACGSAGVHAELCAPHSSGDGVEVLQQLHRMIWQGRAPSEELALWKTSNLFALYKGKGDYTDLQIWRGVVLLDITN